LVSRSSCRVSRETRGRVLTNLEVVVLSVEEVCSREKVGGTPSWRDTVPLERKAVAVCVLEGQAGPVQGTEVEGHIKNGGHSGTLPFQSNSKRELGAEKNYRFLRRVFGGESEVIHRISGKNLKEAVEGFTRVISSAVIECKDREVRTRFGDL